MHIHGSMSQHSKRTMDPSGRRSGDLLEVRRHNPAFSLGTTEFLAPPDPAVLAIVRRSESATVVALHNLSSRPASASLPGDPRAYVDLLRQEPAPASTPLVLGPLEYRWYSSSAS